MARANLDDFHCSYFFLCSYGQGTVDTGAAALNLMDVILDLMNSQSKKYYGVKSKNSWENPILGAKGLLGCVME